MRNTKITQIDVIKPWKRSNQKHLKKPLVIKDKEGKIVGLDEGQVNLTAEFFKELFSSDETATTINPDEMGPPFDKEEVSKAGAKLKNNKSCGKAGIYEPLANSPPPPSLHPKHTHTHAHTHTHTKNVTLIVLLSVFRKVLTIILTDRTWNDMKRAFPKSQAGDQEERPTTEQVFTLKTTIKKAISTDNCNILLDISKAFDSISWNKSECTSCTYWYTT